MSSRWLKSPAQLPRFTGRRRLLSLLFLGILVHFGSNGRCEDPPVIAKDLLTVAEQSEFKATSTYAQVMDLCKRIADRSARIHRTEFGKSHEGRPLPLLIVADPPLETAEAVRATEKLVVFAMANIHAGEVCGKEALQMIAREASGEERPSYLDHVVLLLAPIYNADGNERMDKDNRPGQVGPDEGMGERENAQGLDLNRDHLKLESSEARSLARLLQDYNPGITIDCHATNGSAHRYVLTYDGPRHPATPGELVDYTRETFLPEIGRRLEMRTGYRSFFYGNFSPDRSQWESYPAWPRYNTQYIGLRGRISILSEAYAYASFQDRVLATKAFVEEIVRLASEKSTEIKAKLAEAEKDARDRDQEVAIITRTERLATNYKILGYEPTSLPPYEETKGKTQEYDLPVAIRAIPVKSVKVPYAYVLPAELHAIAANLELHGVKLEELREDLTIPAERYVLTGRTQAPEAYQGHYSVTMQVTASVLETTLQAGSLVVRCDQPLNRLIVQLLEPEAEDGLGTWNFWDAAAKIGEPLPLVRIVDPQPMLTGEWKSAANATLLKKPLQFDDVLGDHRAALGGSPNSGVQWLPGGTHYVQRRDGQTWKIEARTGKAALLFDKAKVAEALAKATGQSPDEGAKLLQSANIQWDRSCEVGLLHFANDLYAIWSNGEKAIRLTETPEDEELTSFSPNGKQIAFVRDFDLYAVSLDAPRERRLTTDGNATLRHGKADWVYFEEIYNRDWRGYQWSPDSKWLAFLEYNDTNVRDYFVLNHIPPRGFLEREHYPKSGDPIPQVRLGIVSSAGGSPQWQSLDGYSADNCIVTRFGWVPDSSRLYVYLQDRAQKWLDIRHLERSSGIFSDRTRWESKTWVPDPDEPTYLKDGSYLICNEASGWRHIERHHGDGSLAMQLTSGEWEVRSLLGIDAIEAWVYFVGTKESPVTENLYRVRLDGSGLERVTTEPGDHAVSMSEDFTLFVDSHSDTEHPTRSELRTADGAVVRRLDTNPVAALDKFQLQPVERISVQLKSGFQMPCTMIRPAGESSSEGAAKFPVWIMTYGGPHAPTIRDSWQNGRGMEQLLASMGIIAFRCDPESASGQGAKSTWIAYEQLGVRETQDLESAVDWLTKQPFVDSSRIGLSGHSYGGYLTAYAMTHSDRFAAGIAGAPVTDWRNYDAFYTERYMNTPQENPGGYDLSSVLKAADKLHGKLLLIHGAMDDNVHVQNTLQFAERLQQANKPFEMMIYPTSRHGIFEAHYQRLMIDFMKKTMLEE